MKKTALFIILASFLGLASCEDVIDYQSAPSGKTQLVVDSWITDFAGQDQLVTLTLTQPYFEKTAPKPALNATVLVIDQDTITYTFKDVKQNGHYVWQPKNKNDKILTIGKRYALYIKYDGQEYVSTSETRRVPKIDSITYIEDTLPIVPNDSIKKTGFNAEFIATDFKGPNDTYWIRSYLNDTLKSSPNNITVAWDAAGSQGSNFDGGLFILPIRQSINTRPGDASPRLFQDKDKIRVDIYSIPNEAFFYLSLVRTVSQNGGIFATPISNIPSNVQNRVKGGLEPLGFFCTSAVSTLTTIIDKKKAKKKV